MPEFNPRAKLDTSQIRDRRHSKYRRKIGYQDTAAPRSRYSRETVMRRMRRKKNY